MARYNINVGSNMRNTRSNVSSRPVPKIRGGANQNGSYDNGVVSRREHYHAYSNRTVNHWTRGTGGTNIVTQGYRHTHDGARHGHSFSQGVQEHWSRYPGGDSIHHRGYRHSHQRPGNIGINRRTTFVTDVLSYVIVLKYFICKNFSNFVRLLAHWF